jgi:ATP-dependent helicase/nuclease subunit B
MLNIYTGRAGTGKTRAVMEEIAAAVRNESGGRILVVPEQYSHEAERELCRVCGNSMSLYADVMSFTGMARTVLSRAGEGLPLLDKGGRILCMALALDGLASRLRVYGAARRRPEMQTLLLSQLDELKTACVSPDALTAAADGCSGNLSDKLRDLALIAEAYDAVVSNGRADPSDRLTRLAEAIPDSDFGPETYIYIDGFTDFTAQERRVIAELLKKGAEVTVCLTCGDGDSEVYAVPRAAMRALERTAGELGEKVGHRSFEGAEGKKEPLKFFEDNMFTYTAARMDGGGAVSLYRASGVTAECELAAAECVRLARETGCRWRDIAVAVRGFEDYRPALESMFAHYGVPLYLTRKSDMMSRPLPALIAGAYEIIAGGWESGDVFAYLRTGLAGLSPEETDELENYVLMWNLRGSAWTRPGPWRQHPGGWGSEYTDETGETLRRINDLRRRAARPLEALAQASAEAVTAAGQARALAEYFKNMGLARRLAARAEELRADGRAALAAEYSQLWELAVSALEQTAAVLGETEMDRTAFGRLYTLVLSQYDVGTIPVSLDRVSAGDFDRMRRRNIKHLIVLGASDDRLPKAAEAAGVFSEDERRQLLEMDIDLGGAGDDGLWREFTLIYNTLTLPRETLTMAYSADGGDGGCRPSFVMNRAAALFGLDILPADAEDERMNAPAPAMELAARGLRGGSPARRAAAEYFKNYDGERLRKLEAAAALGRGKLSEGSVRALYGQRLSLSASRIDKFASCRFAYFVQYGLKAKPRRPAGLTPPEVGTFMHFVLQHTAAEAVEKGGFAKISDDELDRLTDKYIAEYVRTELNDFQEKTARFRYLFTRLTKDVRRVVRDMADELRASDFAPLDFELDFGADGRIPPVELGAGKDSLRLTGIADRVDGWVHDGKLYLRVVDYKTGRKKFDLSDVWYGMGLQMLLYLFTLQKNGKAIYGREIVPAGVLYVPARDVMLSAPADPTDEETDKLRSDALRRSGLVLDSQEVLNAMEHGDAPRYLPVKFRNGVPSGDALATAEGFGQISRHIDDTLQGMARELKQGSIAADPYYRSQQENACMNCEYFDACHFSDGDGDDHIRYITKMKPAQVWDRLKGGGGNV